MSMTSQALDALTIENVRAWAQSMEPTAEVGFSSMPFDCPLARFLRTAQNVYEANVFRHCCYVVTPDGAETRDLPPWARRFVWVVDTCFPGPVTAEKMLVMLDDAEQYAKEQELASRRRELQAMWAASQATVKAYQPTGPDIDPLQVFTFQPVSAAVKTEEKVLVPA